jgi:hypothetical protein
MANDHDLTLPEMLDHVFPAHKERPDAAEMLKRVKDLESLLKMKDIEISLLRRDVSRLRAVIRKRAMMN